MIYQSLVVNGHHCQSREIANEITAAADGKRHRKARDAREEHKNTIIRPISASSPKNIGCVPSYASSPSPGVLVSVIDAFLASTSSDRTGEERNGMKQNQCGKLTSRTLNRK
jgi:hypothetical protein